VLAEFNRNLFERSVSNLVNGDDGISDSSYTCSPCKQCIYNRITLYGQKLLSLRVNITSLLFMGNNLTNKELHNIAK